jgi:WhiB family transcriptional regulator, redox-sensing transcriptional regulator
LDIAREDYLLNGHAGVLAARPDFRKLLDHEQITVAERPHALAPGSQPIETTVGRSRSTIKRSGHMWITDWTTRAACKGTDPDELFVQGAAQNRAKLICRGCPVRTECLADALDNGIEFGVWGGMTERERRALLRRRPDVTSWRDLLERARNEYERQSIDELVAS